MNTTEQLEQNVTSIRDDLDMLVGIINGGEVTAETWANLVSLGADLPEADDDDEDGEELDQEAAEEAARQLLDEMPLAIEVMGKRELGSMGWEVTHLEVTFCTGGPHIELNTGTGQVVGYWGGDEIYRSVSADVVAYWEALAEM